MIEDLAAFFADFGVTVTYASQTAVAIFDRPSTDSMLSGRMVTTAYSIRFRTTDLVGLKHGDQVSIAGVTYSVNEVLAQVDGATTIANLQQQ